MFLFKFWSYMMGYVVLMLEGQGLEKFVNMAISRGIYLWDITKVGNNRMLVKARVNSFRPLRHICRRVGCRMKIRQKRGLPFILLQLKRRKMMLAGAILFLCTLYVLSSIVWVVEVKGNKRIPKDYVIKLANQEGLKTGKFKWNIKVDQIQKELNDKVEGAAWVGVEIKGTKAVIEIAEKVLPPSDDNHQAANIVAKKMGLVKEILVLKGEALVKEGEMVRKGQVLIAGEIKKKEDPNKQENKEENNKKPTEENKPEIMRAKGTVRARVWYEGYGEAPIIETGRRKTGTSVKALSIKILGKEIILKGPKKPPYKLYSVDRKVKSTPKWRNIQITVELVNTVYYQQEDYRIDHGPDRAEQLASEAALKKINKELPEKRKILIKNIEQIRTNDENLIRVKAMVETLEEIGTTEPIKNKEDAN